MKGISVFMFVMMALLAVGSAFETAEELAALEAYTAVAETINQSRLGNSLDKRASSCEMNGISGGTCKDVTTLGSLTFCGGLVSKYKSSHACISSEGAAEMDDNAFTLYTNYYKGLYQTSECAAAFTDYVCSVQFSQCSGTTSVGLCASTCSAYFKWCANKEVTCDASTIPNVEIVAGSTGPSDTCTGAAGSLLPSTLAVAGLALVAMFLKNY